MNKYILRFSIGWACDIYSELSDYIYSIESSFSSEELIKEFELRIHERGELIASKFKELEDLGKSSLENMPNRNKIDKELRDIRNEYLNFLDAKIPGEDLDMQCLDGVYKLEHGFSIVSLSDYFEEHKP